MASKSIADELIVRGWHQGYYVADDSDAVCLEGAIACAFTGDPEQTNAESEQAYALVRGLIPRAYHGSINRWNDDNARTFDQVLRVAKEADEILSGRV